MCWEETPVPGCVRLERGGIVNEEVAEADRTLFKGKARALSNRAAPGQRMTFTKVEALEKTTPK